MSTALTRDAQQCAQAQLDAYNDRNIARFAEVYSDDIQLIDLKTGDVFCNGKPALVERYAAMFANTPDLHCKLVSRVVCEPFVVDEEHVTGLASHSVVHAVATYLVEDGYISKAWFVRRELSE